MGKRRLAWLAFAALAGILYLFENNAGTLSVLCAAILIPGLAILRAALGARRISIALSFPASVAKRTRADGRLTVQNRGILSAHLQGWLQADNLRTGESVQFPLEQTVGARKTKQIDFSLDAQFCGRLQIRCGALNVLDSFGLTCWKLPLPQPRYATVWPTLCPLEPVLSPGGVSQPDSDQYDPRRPGSDPSETLQIREYQPGDSIKAIHWKLSQKTDHLLVREFGLPVRRPVLILVESILPQGCAPQVADAMVEIAGSLCTDLLDAGIAPALGWNEPQTGALALEPLQTQQDLDAALRRLLAVPQAREGEAVTACFCQEQPHCAYGHVVVLTPQLQPEAAGLYNGNHVLQLLPYPLDAGLQPDGTYLACYDAAQYADSLSRMEI